VVVVTRKREVAFDRVGRNLIGASDSVGSVGPTGAFGAGVVENAANRPQVIVEIVKRFAARILRVIDEPLRLVAAGDGGSVAFAAFGYRVSVPDEAALVGYHAVVTFDDSHASAETVIFELGSAIGSLIVDGDQPVFAVPVVDALLVDPQASVIVVFENPRAFVGDE